MGNWKKQKYKRKTVRPKRISHRQIAEISNQSNKYMRLDSKNLYTSLINKIHNMDISKIEISSGKEIHNSVRCSIHETHYYIAIKTPTDKMVEFIHNLVKAWNEEKKVSKNLSDYEMLLYLSFNEKSSPINEFRKIPLSKSKKLRVFYTLSLEECHKLSNNYYAGLGDLIPIIFPWIQEDPGDDGTAYWSDDESDGNRGGGGKPKYGFTEGFGYWRPGPGLIAAKMPPRDIGGYGGTGLEILRSTHINQKEIIESRKHDKKTKGEYGNIAVIVQDKKPRDTLIRSNGSEWKVRTTRLSEILREHSEYARVQVDKPIEGKSQRIYHHTGTWRITGHIKEDETKGGQRNTHRHASSVAACKKKGKRGKIRIISHPRRKK